MWFKVDTILETLQKILSLVGISTTPVTDYWVEKWPFDPHTLQWEVVTDPWSRDSTTVFTCGLTDV